MLLERKLTDVLNDLSIVLSMLMNIAFEEGDMKRRKRSRPQENRPLYCMTNGGYSPLLLPMDLALKEKDVEKSIAYIRERNLWEKV